MSTVIRLGDQLSRLFSQPADGVVGLVDNLLSLCRDSILEVHWVSDRIRLTVTHVTDGDLREVVDVDERKSVLRAVIARFAGLCNEAEPGSVSPYQGVG